MRVVATWSAIETSTRWERTLSCSAMRTGSGQMGLQAGGSTMITPSALAASGDASNDTTTANTIRDRIEIRRMAVSSPGRPTLAAAWVGDAARVIRVTV